MFMFFFVLVVIAACMYLVNLIPMDPPWPTVIKVVALLCTLLWIAQFFGLTHIQFPHN